MTKTYCDHCGDEITDKNRFSSHNKAFDYRGISVVVEIKQNFDFCRSCAGHAIAHGELPPLAVTL